MDAEAARRVEAEGIVLTVRCRPENKFAVMLGPAPDVTWYECSDPPRLGSVVRVTATQARQQQLAVGSATVLEGEIEQTIDRSAPISRHVPKAVVDRVQSAMRRTLFSYQLSGASWIAERLRSGRGAILADDPGLGKTTQTVAAICALNLFPAVIVCPSSLKLNWPKEFKYSRANPRVVVIDGRRGPIPKGDVYVVNYGVLLAREIQIARLRPAVIVYDEAHELKEPRASAKHRAAVATRLAHHVGRVIALTGSPLMNHPREFWRLLHIVDPKEWPDFDAFDLRYLRPQTDGKLAKRIVTTRGRAENVTELRVRVDDAMLRRKKDEVAGDLPPKTSRSIVVKLEAIDQHAYDEAEKDVVAWLLKMGLGRRAMMAAKTIGIAKLTMLRRIAAVGKMRVAVPRYLSLWFGVSKPAPLVVFGHHRSVLSGVSEHAKKLGIRAVGIEGSDDVIKRQRAVDLFQEGRADLFLCPIRAGGVGINLQRASDSLFLERDWSPSVLRQAEDRTHRLGQIRPVTITYLDARGTVDEHVAQVVAEKSRLIQRLVDGDMHDGATQAVAVNLFKRLASKGGAPVKPSK